MGIVQTIRLPTWLLEDSELESILARGTAMNVNKPNVAATESAVKQLDDLSADIRAELDHRSKRSACL